MTYGPGLLLLKPKSRRFVFSLLRRGYLLQKKLIVQQELKDVAMEANGFSSEWAASIFQSAHEILQATRIRERAAEVAEQAAVERAWWNEKRQRASRELLGENSDEDGVLVESSGSKGAARPSTTAQRKGKSAT